VLHFLKKRRSSSLVEKKKEPQTYSKDENNKQTYKVVNKKLILELKAK